MMASTYTYGGEFSSDEDTDKPEQVAGGNGKVQPKFSTDAGPIKPSRSKIEETIAAIKSEKGEVDLPDDLLAGLLDQFQIPRGPIVGSTRALYKKIVIKKVLSDDDVGGAENTKAAPVNGAKNRFVAPGSFTTDEEDDDDDEGVRVPRNVYYEHERDNKNRIEPMEVDDMKTDGVSEESDAETSDSEVVDVTPVKPAPSIAQQKVQAKPAMRQLDAQTKKIGLIRKEVPKKVNTRSKTSKSDLGTESRVKADSTEVKAKSKPTNDLFNIKNKQPAAGISKFKIIFGFLVVLAIAVSLAYYLDLKK